MNKVAFIQGITPIYKAGFFTSVLYLCFFSLLFVARLEQSYITIGNIGLVFLGMFTQVVLYVKLRNNQLYIRFMKKYIFFIALMCINFVLVHNFELKQLLHGAITLPALAMLIYFFDYRILVYLLPFGLVFFLIIFKWFILGLGPDEITVNSRNYIVYFLFIYAMPYLFHCYRTDKIPSIILPLLFVVIAILAIGRASIIMSVFFLVGWLMMLLKTTKYKLLMWGLIFVIIVYTIHIGFFSDNFSLLFSRFEKEGFESSNRTDAWLQYITYSFASIKNLLFGTRTHTVPLVKKLSDSIHNSYLTAHAYLGIGFVYYLYLAFRGYFVFVKQRHYLMIAFLGALLIKAFVDADFPCTAVGGDIYICVLILTGINYKYPGFKQNRE